jgi:transcriptional regulator with XRE-family HTH domain
MNETEKYMNNDAEKNKKILANNLNRFLQLKDIDRNQLCASLDIKYSTLADWLNAKKYPRIDKIEMLANYFGVQKSDLIEEKDVQINVDPRIQTLAAHHEGNDWTQEEADEIEKFIKYVLSQREEK